jgi:hypothetical protein
MSKFDLPNAVTLFTQNVTSINSLWTVYVFATFALAGYGLSAPTIEIETAIVVTAGFWAFAFGHWKLLKQALVINRSLKPSPPPRRGTISSEGRSGIFLQWRTRRWFHSPSIC